MAKLCFYVIPSLFPIFASVILNYWNAMGKVCQLEELQARCYLDVIENDSLSEIFMYYHRDILLSMGLNLLTLWILLLTSYSLEDRFLDSWSLTGFWSMWGQMTGSLSSFGLLSFGRDFWVFSFLPTLYPVSGLLLLLPLWISPWIPFI